MKPNIWISKDRKTSINWNLVATLRYERACMVVNNGMAISGEEAQVAYDHFLDYIGKSELKTP